jgi:hypothetical protein
MSYLSSTKSVLRKTILIGWAVAVVWIYLGNLVNFHMNHIWGKQLIPVEWSTTHGKEKKSSQLVKNERNSSSVYSGFHHDFIANVAQDSKVSYFEIVSTHLNCIVLPALSQGTQALSLRGPPSA